METRIGDTSQELLELLRRQSSGGTWTEADRQRLLELQKAKVANTSEQKPHDATNALQRQGLAGGRIAEMTPAEREAIIAESRRNMERKADRLR